MLLLYSNIVSPKRVITAPRERPRRKQDELDSTFDIFNIFSPALAE